MSSIENYDGLCGIIHLHSSSDKRVRCKYEFGHSGPHSWENKRIGLTITGGCFVTESISFFKRLTPANEGRKKIVIGMPDDMSEKV